MADDLGPLFGEPLGWIERTVSAVKANADRMVHASEPDVVHDGLLHHGEAIAKQCGISQSNARILAAMGQMRFT